MKKACFLIWVAWALVAAGLAGEPAGTLALLARGDSSQVTLAGAEDRVQLVASTGGRDVTREAGYVAEPPGIVAVDARGYVTPLADGEARVTATLPGGGGASLAVKVVKFSEPRPASFANDVLPVLTRNHCNSGACHAKSTGHNGFQLSLLGFDPEMDHEMITEKSRGRRVSLGAPESSLLLAKASGEIPHQGGARLERGSADYETIRRWIEGGARMDDTAEAIVEGIEVHPAKVVAAPGGLQQLQVTALFSDGTRRDVTRLAQYEANQTDMALPGETGLISLKEKPGVTSVMVRFQKHIGVFSATIPVGAALEASQMPPPVNLVDEEVFAQLRVLGLPPSGLADDGTFLRRVTLDIAGRLPTLEESREFLASSDPAKRSRKIDALLESRDYADLFAGKWAGLLRNKVADGTEWVSRDSQAFHAWIRTSLNQNKPFDQFMSELVLASGKARENPAVSWYRVVTDKKEQMQDIAQVFLGVRMQCAQCHHHPYERWSQDDYYSFAAFFSTIDRKKTPKLPEEDIVYHNRKPAGMANPNTKVMLKPRLLGAEKELEAPVEFDPRLALAEWMSAPGNPHVARVVANRYWKHFMGRGLVEPEDDVRPTNPATHPALLDRLAKHFVDSRFDLKGLVRVICNSKTYQMAETPNEKNAEDTQNYARFQPRRMPAEMMLDAINEIAGAQNTFNRQPLGVRAVALPNEEANRESEFLTMFGRPQMDTACECERTGEANLGQSLHLINSDLLQAKLALGTGRAATLAKAKDVSDVERLEEIYLRALSRHPAEPEAAVALAHLKKKRDLAAADPAKLPPARAEQEAWEDILWVVMNSKEFLFNH